MAGQAILGDLESLGVGKESTFGTFAPPTIWHAFTEYDPKPKNILIPRTGARKHWGQARPVTAGFEASATLDVEPDSDVYPQLIVFGMGGQTTPSTALLGSSLAAGTSVGATSFTITTSSAMANDPSAIMPGQTITFDTGTLQETLTVAAVTPSNSTTTPWAITTTGAATKAHASSSSVTVTGTTGYRSSLTMSTLPSFSIELNRVTDAVRYLGCMVDTMAISMSPKNGLSTKFGLVYQTELVTTPGATTTPVYSTKTPFIFEHPYNISLFNGAIMGQFGQVAVLNWSINVNNNLLKTYHSFGQGRLIQAFPQQQRKITGSVTLGFETNAAYLAFLGASTGPAAITVPGVNMSFLAVSGDTLDATTGTPYALSFVINNATISTHAINNKSTSVLQQTFQWEAAESTSGANDDLKMSYLGSLSTVF